MKKINLYNKYLGSAIIILIILSSVSIYFVSREIVSQKYIGNKTYISMFYNEYFSDSCKYNNRTDEKIEDKKEVEKCIQNQKNKILEKREFRYKFNIVKYGVLLVISMLLLLVHSFLYLIRKK